MVFGLLILSLLSFLVTACQPSEEQFKQECRENISTYHETMSELVNQFNKAYNRAMGYDTGEEVPQDLIQELQGIHDEIGKIDTPTCVQDVQTEYLDAQEYLINFADNNFVHEDDGSGFIESTAITNMYIQIVLSSIEEDPEEFIYNSWLDFTTNDAAEE